MLEKEPESSYRYLLIQYPEVLEYCKMGNFNWYDNTEDHLIFILESYNNNINVSKELYTFLIAVLFKREFDINLVVNKDGLFLNIGYIDGDYYISMKP